LFILAIYNTLSTSVKESRSVPSYLTDNEKAAYLQGADRVCEHTCELKFKVAPFDAEWKEKIQKCECIYTGSQQNLIKIYKERAVREKCNAK